MRKTKTTFSLYWRSEARGPVTFWCNQDLTPSIRQQLLPVQMPTWQVNWLPPVGITMWSKFKPHMKASTREMGTTVLPEPCVPPLPRSNTGALYRAFHQLIFLHKSKWTPYSFLCLGPMLTFISLVPEQIFICLFLLYEGLSF